MRKSPFSAMVFTKNRERLLRGGVTNKTNNAPPLRRPISYEVTNPQGASTLGRPSLDRYF